MTGEPPTVREFCWRCFWPKERCWCDEITTMAVRTRFVFLMHPKEYKQEKNGTGRLTALALRDSLIEMGIGFDDNPVVQGLISDPANYPMLLYPGDGARNVSDGTLAPADLDGRRLVVFLLDGTWACAKKMLKLSPSLQRLDKLMFTPTEKSRFVIKRQPHELCLSTLEATHQFLLALEAAGLDVYPDREQLPRVFQAMQDYQIACASDPERHGYRRKAYKLPEQRDTLPQHRKGHRNLFWKPFDPANLPKSR
ncbi:MAG: tRNA-uridine aminocarboxypropyltransferase [Spirochaetales bacterium]